MPQASFEMFDTRLRPCMALAAIFRMLRNKEATHEVYRINAALDGRTMERNFQRFRQTDLGQRVLADDMTLLQVLSDRESLAVLPEGSLGRAYLDFITSEGLSAEGFQQEMDTSGERFAVAGPARQKFLYHFRHTHDLLHVLTGYGRDLVGELSLLEFSRAHTGNRGIALLNVFGQFKARREYPGIDVKACMKEGLRLGRASSSLYDQDWVAHLAKPVVTVRKQMNIGRPEQYLAVQDRAASLDREYRAALAGSSA